MKESCYELIKKRRSIRKFLNKDVKMNIIYQILDAARWAPSGLNNQPWKFVIIKNSVVKEKIGNLSHYKRIFIEAPVIIPFFLDKNSIYHREKDIMGVGAAVENILLAAEALDLGAVWLGEILKAREEVERILDTPDNLELLGVVALGYPADKKYKERKRKEFQEIIFKEIL